MNIPMSWLKAYVDIDVDIKDFVEDITMSGSKVEAVESFGKDIKKVVVGKVLSVVKHPDADKLVITSIDVGQSSPIQIVTGADNIFEGAYVPVALDGSTLAGGVKIKKGKLRGETSEGMLCSIEELGYDKHDYPESPENGIYIFQEEQELGADVKPILQLEEDVVEYEITSNRPDCFSVLGIAKETAATYKKPFKYPVIVVKEEADGNIKEMISVEIKNSELCPRYIARVVKNVKIEPSPLWMRHRLTASGIRPINNIVDITNYVMLEFGQPMHAFDIDGIDDRKIIVRNANDGEKFTTLDGEERQLDSSMLVIADKNKAVAIAGVMGGENSKVTGHASAVLFESASFNGTNIRLTSKKIGLRTDASSKFEKGLDPNLALEAINRAMQLVEELACGEVVKGIVDCYPNKREIFEVEYSADSINKLLGTNIKTEQMAEMLERLGVKTDNGKAVIPTSRPDLETEADISEEIARLYGYDKIEVTLASGTPTVGKKTREQILEDLIKDTLVAQGLCEGLSYAFESPKVFEKLRIEEDSHLRNTVKIINPLGEDFSIMRTTTLNAMLQSLSTNYNRRNEDASLFEIAKVYEPKQLPLTELPTETQVLTIGMYGKKDFYDLKGVIESLDESLGLGKEMDYSKADNLPFMHPGRTADIFLNGKWLGFAGEVHPAVLENYDIGTKAYVACLDINILYKNASLTSTYKPIPKFPAMKRDISMVVKDEVMVKEIENAIKEKAGKDLESVKLFDVYKGDHMQQGHKSVAYSIFFRSAERTLTEEEITKAMGKILQNLEEKLGAQLREKTV